MGRINHYRHDGGITHTHCMYTTSGSTGYDSRPSVIIDVIIDVGGHYHMHNLIDKTEKYNFVFSNHTSIFKQRRNLFFI